MKNFVCEMKKENFYENNQRDFFLFAIVRTFENGFQKLNCWRFNEEECQK